MIIIRIRATDFRMTVQKRGVDIVFWIGRLWTLVTHLNKAEKILGEINHFTILATSQSYRTN